METFIQKYQKGLVTAVQIDDFIDQWHAGASTQTLPDYLGISQQHYFEWLKSPASLSIILDTYGQPVSGSFIQQIPQLIETGYRSYGMGPNGTTDSINNLVKRILQHCSANNTLGYALQQRQITADCRIGRGLGKTSMVVCMPPARSKSYLKR